MNPTTDGAATATIIGAWLSSAAMAFFGVEWLALLWGFFGALFSLRMTPPESRSAALFTVILSTLAGAALAGAISAHVGADKNMLIAAAFVVGAGAKVIIGATLDWMVAKIRGETSRDARRVVREESDK